MKINKFDKYKTLRYTDTKLNSLIIKGVEARER